MAGHSRSKNGVASLAYVPAIHVLELVPWRKLPLVSAELGLIDEYEVVVQPRLAGHGPKLFDGLSNPIDLKLVNRLELGSGAVAMRYEPRR